MAAVDLFLAIYAAAQFIWLGFVLYRVSQGHQLSDKHMMHLFGSGTALLVLSMLHGVIAMLHGVIAQ